ncbi:MAG: TolC family protein [Bacteroidota bacterium]
MMRIVLLLVLSLIATLNLKAQVVSLDSCISWAYENNRFADNEELIRHSQQLAIENAGKTNLPRLVLDGTGTYQNENITIEMPPVPGLTAPEVPLNFNRLLVNFNQTIYNGRLAAHKKRLDSLSYDALAYQVEVDKAKIKAQITGIYTSIILVHEQLEILNRQIATIDIKAKQLKAGVDAGVVYKSDLTTLQAEHLKLQQSITEVEYLELALRQQLSTLTGNQIHTKVELLLPETEIDESGVESRPELRLLNSKKTALGIQSDLSKVSRLPYVGVFGSAGLGYPGYDIFDSSVSPMMMVGLKVNWNIYDWNKSKNDRQIIGWNQEIISYQYNRLKLQLESELIKQKQEILKLEELITRDKEIINLRKEITQDVSARLSSGTATSTDFLIELHQEAVAELNQSVHVIKLSIARLSYQIIQGK